MCFVPPKRYDLPLSPLSSFLGLCRESLLYLEKSERLRSIAGGGVELNCKPDNEAGIDWMSGFVAEEIWIVDCVGVVENWKVLERVRIRGDTKT